MLRAADAKELMLTERSSCALQESMTNSDDLYLSLSMAKEPPLLPLPSPHTHPRLADAPDTMLIQLSGTTSSNFHYNIMVHGR